MAAIFVLVAVPVQGQPHLEEGGGVLERPSHNSVDPVPDWAKPSDGSSIGDSQAPSEKRPPRSVIEEEMETKAPPPGDEPIPVDGGVALLAAAGAGYAVRKLKEDEEEGG